MNEDWCNIPVSISWDTVNTFMGVKQWLEENVNSLDYRIAGADPRDNTRSLVFFARKQDAMLFTLSWL